MKKLKVLITIISILFLLWVCVSYADVLLHNDTTHLYSEYNFFKIMF